MEERQRIVRDYIAKYPDTQTLTLAKGLYKKYPEWFNTIETARSSIRFFRGNGGKYQRKNCADKSLFRKPGKAGELPPCPPSKAEPWAKHPVAGKVAAILSDIHQPFHDVKALTAAVKHIANEVGPDVLILNGDMMDFFTVSRWEKNPHKRDMKGEIDGGKDILLWLKDVIKPKTIVLKKGNHEERWDHYIWQKAPELWDLPQCRLENMLELDKIGIEMVGDKRPIIFGGDDDGDGGLPILHGHEFTKGLMSPVNPARGAFLRTLHTCIMGHFHQSSQHTDNNMFKTREVSTWSTGCLCGMHPEYAPINRWGHGFAVVHVESPGEWHVDNMRISSKGRVW